MHPDVNKQVTVFPLTRHLASPGTLADKQAITNTLITSAALAVRISCARWITHQYLKFRNKISPIGGVVLSTRRLMAHMVPDFSAVWTQDREILRGLVGGLITSIVPDLRASLQPAHLNGEKR
jgi:hypothetical protein